MGPNRAAILCLALSACGSVALVPLGEGDGGARSVVPPRPGPGAAPVEMIMIVTPVQRDAGPPQIEATVAPEAAVDAPAPATTSPEPAMDATAPEPPPLARDASQTEPAPSVPDASSQEVGAAPDAGAPERPALPCNGACGPRAVCMAGRCQNCSGDQVACDDGCANLKDDKTNCGACGNACVGAQMCMSGVCRCKDGQSLCGLLCIPTMSDVANCGGCGLICLAIEKCNNGQCVPR